MSIVNHKEIIGIDASKQVEAVLLRTSVNTKGETTDQISDYNPNKEVLDVSALVLNHFVLGTTNTYTPRVEFNDLSLVTMSLMCFNQIAILWVENYRFPYFLTYLRNYCGFSNA